MTTPDPNSPNPAALEKMASTLQGLKTGLSQVVYGQSAVIEMVLVGLLAQGHILLEGIPGVAKTTLVKALAHLIQLDYRRIQLTPDLLPAEIVGIHVYDPGSKTFEFQPGPVFTDLLLADELNRTPPKTQSALLEAMEEKQVTLEGKTMALSPLFTVIATLNPVEFEGTYPLPEAQLDRFMMKLVMTYPDATAEKAMLTDFSKRADTNPLHGFKPTPICDQATLAECRQALTQIRVDESILDYILHITHETRRNPNTLLGCSPRAGLWLLNASRAYAAVCGTPYVTPDHVKTVAPHVIRHRLLLTADAQLEGFTTDEVIRQCLNQVTVPR